MTLALTVGISPATCDHHGVQGVHGDIIAKADKVDITAEGWSSQWFSHF
ncbi:hypothetical protein [Pseudomonas sp. IT-232MI5]